MLNGILWALRAGAHLRDLPESFGSWQTVYDYFSTWRKQGLYGRILEALQLRLSAKGKIACDAWGIDSNPIRASRVAAGVSKSCRRYRDEPEDHALGRRRGGFGSKFHLLTDYPGLPLALEVSAGQAHESTNFEPVMDAVRIPRAARAPGHWLATRGTVTDGFANGCGAQDPGGDPATKQRTVGRQDGIRPGGVSSQERGRTLCGLAEGVPTDRCTVPETCVELPGHAETGHHRTVLALRILISQVVPRRKLSQTPQGGGQDRAPRGQVVPPAQASP